MSIATPHAMLPRANLGTVNRLESRTRRLARSCLRKRVSRTKFLTKKTFSLVLLALSSRFHKGSGVFQSSSADGEVSECDDGWEDCGWSAGMTSI